MTTDLLKQLLARCKCGVYLTFNEYKDCYWKTQEGLDDIDARECPPRYSDDVRAGILRTGNLIELQFYPETPVGSYTIVHHDLEQALRDALACCEAV